MEVPAGKTTRSSTSLDQGRSSTRRDRNGKTMAEIQIESARYIFAQAEVERAKPQPQLESVGCDVIRAEKQSGTSTQGRVELRTVLDFIGKCDVLLVTRVDRLARSIGESVSNGLPPRSSRPRAHRPE
jgi:DNA invertase Pin-like site-specific DNA recombinase